MHIKTVFICLLLVLLITSAGLSQTTVVRESFEYTKGTYIDGAGTAGDGWAGSWYIADSSWNHNSQMLTIADTGTIYNGLIGFPIHSVGHQAVGVVPAGWSYIRYARYLDHQWTNTAGNTYWLSFAFDLKWGTPDCWAVVSLWDSTKELIGSPHGWGNDTVTINGITCPKTTISTLDGPQWYVLRMDMKGDSLARVFLWTSPDPDGTAPDTSLAITRGDWSLAQHTYSKIDPSLDSLPVVIHNGFNSIHLEFSNSQAGAEAMFDEVRLATTWADVSSPVNAIPIPTGILVQANDLPGKFELAQNYPNPFNPVTNILYTIKNTGKVRLCVYDILGREVAVLVDGVQTAGSHVVPFNGHNLTSGIYFYRLVNAGTMMTKKMMLLK